MSDFIKAVLPFFLAIMTFIGCPAFGVQGASASPTAGAVTAYAHAQRSARLSETADGGQEYLDKIVFLGDSTTYHLIVHEKLRGGRDTDRVWVPPSDTMTLKYAVSTPIVYPETGEEMTASAAAGLAKPEIMVITLGVNGVSFMDENDFTESYRRLIKKLKEASPDTVFILQSIYPRAEHGFKEYDKVTEPMIDRANVWIEKLCEDEGLRYLDTQSVLKNERGYLCDEYSNGDGLHMTGAAYDAVLMYVRTHQAK